MFGNRDLGVICVFESLPSFRALDMKSAQHGASALSSVRSGRSVSEGGQDMKLRSEVGVGSGVGSGLKRHQ